MTIADNAIADDESEPRPGPHRFGCEKWFEQVRLDIRWNAGAVVHDFNDGLVVITAKAQDIDERV